ncbi:transposase [Streptomyces sp. NPDC002545]
MINGIRFRVRTGIPWRDLPAEYGPWGRIYDLFAGGNGTAPGIGSSPSPRPGPTRKD